MYTCWRALLSRHARDSEPSAYWSHVYVPSTPTQTTSSACGQTSWERTAAARGVYHLVSANGTSLALSDEVYKTFFEWKVHSIPLTSGAHRSIARCRGTGAGGAGLQRGRHRGQRCRKNQPPQGFVCDSCCPPPHFSEQIYRRSRTNLFRLASPSQQCS